MENNISPEENVYVAFLKKESDRGDPEAEYELALLYEKGQEVEADPAYAFKLMYEVAQNNEVRKIRTGGNKNGVYWDGYRKITGLPKAKYCLAYYYENGIGTEVNLAKALEWYSLALKDGYHDAKKGIERLKKL